MNPIDIALFKSIASSPNAVMKELLSPSVSMSPDWIQTPAIKRSIIYMAELALRDASISWVTLLAGVSLSDTERDTLKQAWREGKEKSSDVKAIVAELKTQAMRQAAEKTIGNYYHRVKEAPAKIREHLGILGTEISIIANDGSGYDAKPSSHMQDRSMERTGSWGDITLNALFSKNRQDAGGFPSYSFIIASMPTGQGKSSLAITLAAFALAYNPEKRVTIMSNELPRKIYSGGVLRALREIYAGQEPDEMLLAMMDERLSVYAPSSDDKNRGYSVDTFEKMRQIIFWERPQLAVIDSISGISAPAYSMNNRYSENARHEAKANDTRNMCLDFSTVLYAPGNMSQEEQVRLIKSPEKVNTVMLYGNKAYENACDLSLLGWRDGEHLGKQWIKRCKNRHGTDTGEKWDIEYNYKGGFYQTAARRDINV